MIRPAFRPVPPGRALVIAHAATWGPLLALLLLSGCATVDPPPAGPLRFQKGQVAPGTYLVTLTTSPLPVASVDPRVTTVARAGKPDQSVVTVTMVLPHYIITSPWASPRGNDARTLYEVIAHEVCHAVAAAQGIPDADEPCHREDGGSLR